MSLSCRCFFLAFASSFVRPFSKLILFTDYFQISFPFYLVRSMPAYTITTKYIFSSFWLIFVLEKWQTGVEKKKIRAYKECTKWNVLLLFESIIINDFFLCNLCVWIVTNGFDQHTSNAVIHMYCNRSQIQLSFVLLHRAIRCEHCAHLLTIASRWMFSNVSKF